jgi:histidine triad (HIT) family protein
MLYSLSRTWLGGMILGWVLARFSFALPIDRLVETDSLIAFEHPQPSHPIHILIVPKARYRTIFDLPEDPSEFFGDLMEAVRSLVENHGMEEVGYRLIMNGGPNQEVDHLHFHLLSGEAIGKDAA